MPSNDLGEINVDMKDVMRKVTFTLRMKNVNQAKIRIKIAVWLFRLAAWISWANIEFINAIEEDDNNG